MTKVFQKAEGRINVNEDKNPIKIMLDDIATQVQFQCRYKTELMISSEPIDVATATALDMAIGIGSLKRGFSLNIYDNDSYQNVIGPADKVFIGATVFAKISWSLTTLEDSVSFYIDRCEIDLDGQDVAIVQDNCYAKAVSAKLLSDPVLQSSEVKLSYKTFTSTFGSTEQSALLKCVIRLCVNSENTCVINDANYCSNLRKISGYEFSIDGN